MATFRFERHIPGYVPLGRTYERFPPDDGVVHFGGRLRGQPPHVVPT